MEQGGAMAGHVEFGNDGDETLGAVIDYLAQLVLGEAAAVFAVLIKAAEGGVGSDRGFLGYLGVGVERQAEALIVRQVPMHPVHLDLCGSVDYLLRLLDGEDMAHGVKHKAPVFISGSVLNTDSGAAFAELSEGLLAVEFAARRAVAQLDAALYDSEHIRLVRKGLVLDIGYLKLRRIDFAAEELDFVRLGYYVKSFHNIYLFKNKYIF